MTQQKAVRLVNINTIITSLCTAILIWVGTGQVKIYNAILLQPSVDAAQEKSINKLSAEVGQMQQQNRNIENEQNKHAERIYHIEAILPDKNQFKIK